MEKDLDGGEKPGELRYIFAKRAYSLKVWTLSTIVVLGALASELWLTGTHLFTPYEPLSVVLVMAVVVGFLNFLLRRHLSIFSRNPTMTDQRKVAVAMILFWLIYIGVLFIGFLVNLLMGVPRSLMAVTSYVLATVLLVFTRYKVFAFRVETQYPFRGAHHLSVLEGDLSVETVEKLLRQYPTDFFLDFVRIGGYIVNIDAMWDIDGDILWMEYVVEEKLEEIYESNPDLPDVLRGKIREYLREPTLLQFVSGEERFDVEEVGGRIRRELPVDRYAQYIREIVGYYFLIGGRPPVGGGEGLYPEPLE